MKPDVAGDSIFNLQGWIVPDSSVVEQASGLLAAQYVASLISPGEKVADLTAGLGINTLCFSRRAEHVYAIEIDEKRALALKQNLRNLKVENVSVVNSDCTEWLENTNLLFDTIYIDPARRTASGRRFFKLSDCSPNVLELMPALRNHTARVLIKCSPLLDISAVEKEIPQVSGFHIIEVDREVKELLVDIDFNASAIEAKASPIIDCVILSKNKEQRIIKLSTSNIIPELLADLNGIETGGIIYEPAPSIMKAGRFGEIVESYPGLKKLDPNTHLFYHDSLYEEFPGRVFKIISAVSSKDLKKMKGAHFNVISRNHPAAAQELQDRFKLLPSDSEFLIATRCAGKKIIFQATKLDPIFY